MWLKVASASLVGLGISLKALIYFYRHSARKAPLKVDFSGGFGKTLSIPEAKLILGLESPYTPQQLSTRYSALLKSNHPDQGGSTYLTEKIIQAHDMLK